MNTFSKLYLALLGQFPWKYLPTIPVEMILLPKWSPFHIYKMSSWSRAMLIPLAIINHFKPTRELPGDETTARALSARHRAQGFHACRATAFLRPGAIFSCAPISSETHLDPLDFARCASAHWKKRSAGCWSESARGATGSAAVFPAMLNSLIALRALGLFEEASGLRKSGEGFRRTVCRRSGGFPNSTVPFAGLGHRDQCYLAGGIGSAGRSPALQKAADWLVEQGSASPRRLDGEQSASRSERLGVRIQQRLLSGHRRHRDGADGVASGSARTSQAALDEVFRARARLAVELPMSRRRLGCVRQGSDHAIGSKTCRSPITTRFSIRLAAI